MKIVMIACLIAAAVVSFAGTYAETLREERQRMVNAGESVAGQVCMPDVPLLSDPDDMYPLILAAAGDAEVSVVRTCVAYQTGDRVEIDKYVLLTDATRFAAVFRLKSGRFLTAPETVGGDRFVSTVDTNVGKQVGVLRSFAGSCEVVVRPLQAAYERLPVAGVYFVHGERPNARAAFVDALVARVNRRFAQLLEPGDHRLDASDFAASRSPSGGGPIADPRAGGDAFRYVGYAVVAVMVVVLAYSVVHRAKSIGVMKMHGLSSARAWYAVVGRPVAAGLAFSLAASAVASLAVRDTTAGFVTGSLLSLLGTYAALSLGAVVAGAYVLGVPVGESVKSRRDTRGILILNGIMKAACAILLVLAGLWAVNQYVSAKTHYRLLGPWAASKDYGVFHPVRVGRDDRAMTLGLPSDPVRAEVHGLYPVLNRMGSVFVDATRYEQEVLDLDETTGGGGFRCISVNPHYLRRFPILDSCGRRVGVSDTTSDFVILVPERYRGERAALLRYFRESRTDGENGIYVAEPRAFGRVTPARVRRQRFRIIWLQNGQRVFSFNPDVFPSELNMILDPIIAVITMRNHVGLDIANMCSGGGATNALKVRLVDRDSVLTLRRLRPVLRRLRLDDNLTHLVAVQEYMLKQIHELERAMFWAALLCGAIAAGLAVILAQSLSVLFSRYRRQIVVRRLLGAGFLRAYRECIWVLAPLWVVQVAACVAASAAAAASPSLAPLFGSARSATVLALSLAVVAFECLVAVVALSVIEKRNTTKAISEGS